MTRNRKSAKDAGARFESSVAAYLNVHVDDRIERRRLSGGRDRGDISGLRHHGQRVVIECKNTARLDLAGWAAEAEIERGNDDAVAGVIISKRHGKGQPGDQWVHMTLRDFVALLNGNRHHLWPEPPPEL